MDWIPEGHQGGMICVDPETWIKDNRLISLEVCFVFVVENFVAGPFLSLAVPFHHCASYSEKQEKILMSKVMKVLREVNHHEHLFLQRTGF